MKTERRHELQTNELADWLGRGVQLMEDNARMVLGIIVALAIMLGAYFYLSGSAEGRNTEGWNSYLQARDDNDVNKLNALAQEYQGTSVSAWAQLALADDNLISGTNELFVSRITANDRLRAAAEGYERVLQTKAAARESLLGQRATFGLARTYESLGELDRARELYAKLADAKQWQPPLYAADAAHRLADLDQRSTREFYDWFARHEPTAEASPPMDFEPLDLEALPDSPPLGESLLETTPTETAPAETEGAVDAPANESEAAADVPADEAPAAEPAPQP